MTNVTSISKEKMRIGISTSVVFDMSEPDAIWQAEQKNEIPRGSYRKYMLDRLQDPLPLREVDFNYLKRLSEKEGIYISLMSRNSTLTGYRAVKTLVDNGLIPETFVFTNGASIAEYCPIYKLDMFVTSNKSDWENAHKLGISSVLSDHIKSIEGIDIHSLIKPNPEEKLFTKPHIIKDGHTIPQAKAPFKSSAGLISIAYDRDKVLHGSEGDDYFAENGLTGYLDRERRLINTPIEEGPFFDVYNKMVRMRHAFIVHSITSRGAEAAIRDLYDSVQKGLDHNGETHSISSGVSEIDKFQIQEEMERRYGTTPLIDDGEKHIELSRKNAMIGWLVHSTMPKAYLGS